MKFGVYVGDERGHVPAVEHWTAVQRVAEAAQVAGATSFMMGQHYLYGDLRWLQPVPALARLAADLDPPIRLMTGLLQLPLHDPIVLAEQLATLDVVTGGRLSIGLGVGYRREEFDHLGIPFSERGSRFEEAVRLMTSLWSDDEVTFAGDHWRLDGARPHIQPVQRPRPPLLFGAAGPRSLRRAAQLADGWLVPPRTSAADLAGSWATYESMCAVDGRAPGPVSVMRHVIVGRDREDALDRYRGIGMARALEYIATGHAQIPQAAVEDFDGFARTHVIHGNASDCLDQVRHLVTSARIDSLVLRVHWPDMGADEAVRFVEDLGREFLPGLLELR